MDQGGEEMLEVYKTHLSRNCDLKKGYSARERAHLGALHDPQVRKRIEPEKGDSQVGP